MGQQPKNGIGEVIELAMGRTATAAPSDGFVTLTLTEAGFLRVMELATGFAVRATGDQDEVFAEFNELVNMLVDSISEGWAPDLGRTLQARSHEWVEQGLRRTEPLRAAVAQAEDLLERVRTDVDELERKIDAEDDEDAQPCSGEMTCSCPRCEAERQRRVQQGVRPSGQQQPWRPRPRKGGDR